MFDDEMAEYVDEEEVRRLLADLGYKNPSREAIEQTILETRNVFRQQHLLDEEVDDPRAPNHEEDARLNNRSEGPYLRGNEPQREVVAMQQNGAHDDYDRFHNADDGGYEFQEEGSAQVQENDAAFHHGRHDHLVQRMPHFLAAEKMDESDMGGSAVPPRYRYRGGVSPAEEAISAAGRTTSTPANVAGRTPTSGRNLRSKANKQRDNIPKEALQGGGRDARHDTITIPSVASSRSGVVPADPYHCKVKDPQHLQHFEPYLKLVQQSELQQERRSSVSQQQSPQPLSARKAENHRGIMKPASRPRPSSRPSTAASTRNNVIYAFTGDRAYRPTILTSRGAQARPVARHADPVSRGAHMRQLWKQDDFLTQRGRNEERWQVRRSMLSWEGQ